MVEVGGGEVEVEGGEVLVEVADLLGAGDRYDLGAAGEQPSQGYLSWGGVVPSGDGAERASPP
ncbi:hypothetical protein GCM10010191_58840 [Actinomadura vinacea]|uniref:Uncharacterized protein n=1 Tax=Actinomadura vinacea TaxID=115336 RepID=A0ABN3JQD3_9ACTN